MASQSDSAYSNIRESILSTALAPGTRLTESGLSRDLGLGRFAVREALRRLHGERLVEKVGSRHVVPFLTPEDAHDVVQLRSILEIGALRFMAGNPPRNVLKEIGEAAEDYASLVKKGYFNGALEADLRFHRAIVAVSRNSRLIDAYNAANLPLLQVTVGLRPAPLNDYTRAAEEHMDIFAALNRKQTTLAATLLEKHLKRGKREILAKNRT